MLAIGSRAPEFTLPDQDDRTVSLSTLFNRGPLILYFYPADFTPGCTREACMLRDLHAEGHTILMVTHNPMIGRLADRRIELAHGRLAQITLFSAEDAARATW